MNHILAVLILISSSALFFHGALAGTHNEDTSLSYPDSVYDKSIPYITVKVGVEISGLESAAKEAADGLKLIGESLQNISENKELSPEHYAQIEQTLSSIDELSRSLNLVVEQFPATLEKSMLPVLRASNDLSDQIKQTLVIAAIVIILIILVALTGVYYFVLAPGTRSIVKTTKLLNDLADTLESTASIVEISSERNLQVMREVKSIRDDALEQ